MEVIYYDRVRKLFYCDIISIKEISIVNMGMYVYI